MSSHDLGPDLTALVPWMMSVALAMTGRRVDAENLVQETVARVLGRASQPPHNLRAYLRRAMTNIHIDALRSNGRLHSVPEVPEDVRKGQGHDPALAVDVERALSGLSAMERTVVVLRYMEDLGSREVAALIGTSPGSVRRIAHTTLAILRRGPLWAYLDNHR